MRVMSVMIAVADRRKYMVVSSLECIFQEEPENELVESSEGLALDSIDQREVVPDPLW